MSVEANGTRNLMDLYLPDRAAAKVPVIIAIHGGGLRTGSKEMFRPKALRLAERGYAVAAVNYRLSPDHYLPAQIHDLPGQASRAPLPVRKAKRLTTPRRQMDKARLNRF
jgi:acetyl esterase/lipase